MYLIKLRLNESKTEFLLIGKSCDSEKTNIRSLDIGEIKVSPCDQERNLGVIFDKALNMKSHILNVSKVFFFINILQIPAAIYIVNPTFQQLEKSDINKHFHNFYININISL